MELKKTKDGVGVQLISKEERLSMLNRAQNHQKSCFVCVFFFHLYGQNIKPVQTDRGPFITYVAENDDLESLRSRIQVITGVYEDADEPAKNRLAFVNGDVPHFIPAGASNQREGEGVGSEGNSLWELFEHRFPSWSDVIDDVTKRPDFGFNRDEVPTIGIQRFPLSNVNSENRYLHFKRVL